MDNITIVENKRKKLATFFWIVFPISVALFVTSFFIINYGNSGNNSLLIASFIAIIIGFVGLIISLLIPNKVFNRIIRNTFNEAIAKSVYKNYDYTQKNGLSFKEINKSLVFKKPDDFATSETFRFSYKDVEIVSSNYVFTKIEVYTDNHGTHTERKEYPGRYFEFHLERNLGEGLEIIEKRYNSNVFHKSLYKEKVEFESMEFNKKFRITTNNKEKAFYFIRPKELLDIVELEKAFKGNLVMVFNGNYFYFIIDNNNVNYGVSFLKKFNENSLEIIKDFYKIPLKIVDKLGLDKDRFNNTSIDE